MLLLPAAVVPLSLSENREVLTVIVFGNNVPSLYGLLAR